MRAAVLGHPIAHSLSPVLHRAAYEALGLDWQYDAVDVDEEGLPGFVDGLDSSWAGLSLTMPLKRAVVPLLDESSELVKSLRCANTVVLRDGRRVGHNTDVAGIETSLREAGVTSPTTFGIVGAGATAGSALAAAIRLESGSIVVTARRPEALRGMLQLASRLGDVVQIIDWQRKSAVLASDVVVSALPGDASSGLVRSLPPRTTTLLDVAYHPWPTALAAAWQGRGGDVIPGHRLLLHQAAGQVRLMTGSEAPVSAMDAALRRALGH